MIAAIRSLNLRKHQNSMHRPSELKEIYIDSTLNQPNHNIYEYVPCLSKSKDVC